MAKRKKTSAQIWRARTKSRLPFEKHFANKLNKLFKRQKNELLTNANKVKSKLPIKPKKAKEDDIVDLILFDKNKWDGILSKDMKPLYGSMGKLSGTDALGEVSLGINFNIEDPNYLDAVNSMPLQFASNVNATTLSRVSKSLKQIIANGGTLEDVREKIQELFQITGARARSIARTEMAKAANISADIGYRQSGVVKKKEWRTSLDQKVRDTHKRANGQVRKFDNPFKVGTSKLMFPTDTSLNAPPEEIVNCRCIALAKLERTRTRRKR